MSTGGVGNRIVVGVDGSPASTEALRWAAGQARLTGASVDAVIAWRPVTVFGWEAPSGALDVRATASAVLREAVRQVFGGDRDRPVQVREHVVEGYPGRVLVDAARDAQLLVVGHRGHTGLAEALLGSVSQSCVQHAPCPVVVVRAPRPGRAGSPTRHPA